MRKKPTISDNLASAGKRVGGASRWRSIASKTRAKRKSSGRAWCLSIFDSSTVSWETVSHLAGGRSHCKARATLPTMVSKRWRLVMHSIELTMANLRLGLSSLTDSVSSLDKTSAVTAVLPVASMP